MLERPIVIICYAGQMIFFFLYSLLKYIYASIGDLKGCEVHFNKFAIKNIDNYWKRFYINTTIFQPYIQKIVLNKSSLNLSTYWNDIFVCRDRYNGQKESKIPRNRRGSITEIQAQNKINFINKDQKINTKRKKSLILSNCTKKIDS